MISYQEESVRVLPVVGYEGLYEVTSEGEVYSLNYHREGRRVKLKESINHGGYKRVELCKDGRIKRCSIHRLVAEAFIPNPEGKPQIDHINTIRTDNRAENLRWCTSKENANNPMSIVAHRNANVKSFAKAVYCIELGRVFESATDAARELGLWQGNISACCRGKYEVTGGYHFRFYQH